MKKLFEHAAVAVDWLTINGYRRTNQLAGNGTTIWLKKTGEKASLYGVGRGLYIVRLT